MQIGKPGQSKGSNDTENLRRPAKTFIDKRPTKSTSPMATAITASSSSTPIPANTNGTGEPTAKARRRDLGNYNPDAPPAQQFRNPVHCAELSVDRLLYVCDRQNDRLQVFKPDGTFVKEMYFEKRTLGSGSVWDIAFSKDPQQKYIYLADGENDRYTSSIAIRCRY